MCNCNNKLRPCKFKEWDLEEGGYVTSEGSFHEWGVTFEDYEENEISYSVWIIEKGDGTVVLIPADWIQFTDKEDNQ